MAGGWGLLRPAAAPFRWLADRVDPPPPAPPPVRIQHRSSAVPRTTVGAETRADAEERYRATKECDPFPDVPPSLLNSAHIEDYAIETAMVFPYQRERRKTASYAIRIGERMSFFDPDKPRGGTYHDLKPFESFELPPNSLVYVQTKELFQLPNYMAVRFNLHIELVHKGLLLGTGPLVDPGFSGQLLIPLHNMTANTYVLAEDDEVIWVEFTKVSPHPDWIEADRQAGIPGYPVAGFAPFPGPKTDLTPADYFKRARRPHESRPDAGPYEFPANAIPGEVGRAAEMAARAGAEAQSATTTVNRIRNFGLVAALVAAFGLILPIFGLIGDATSMVQSETGITKEAEGRLRADVTALRRELTESRAADARLLGSEWCALPRDDREGSARGRALLARLRFTQADADGGTASTVSDQGAAVPVTNAGRPGC